MVNDTKIGSTSTRPQGLTSDDLREAEEAAAREYFLSLSKNELVTLCLQADLRSAHRGMKRQELLALLEGQPETGEDPVDKYRRKVMDFIAAHRGRITLSCHGDCFQHSGAKVIQCYLTILKGQKET